MVIIETNHPSFEEYLKTLSKPARKNYKHCQKLYGHLGYKAEDFARVEEFMRLWSQQLVRNKHPEWAFPVGVVRDWYDKKELLVLGCPIALHFIQKRNGYWECHPPMYDKKNEELGTWMWFQLIKFAIENKLGVLNMGGGVDNWREMIKNRANYPNPKYKWRFVPESVKENPDSQPNYVIRKFTLERI